MNFYTCRECDQPGDADRFMEHVKADLLAKLLCFTCDIWTEKWLWAQAGDIAPGRIRSWSADGRTAIVATVPVVRINGEHYTFNEPAGPGEFQGYGGLEMTAIMNDGRVLTSRNVWHQGTIPEHWRARLPDNAVWRPYEPASNPLHGILAEMRQHAESETNVTGS